MVDEKAKQRKLKKRKLKEILANSNELVVDEETNHNGQVLEWKKKKKKRAKTDIEVKDDTLSGNVEPVPAVAQKEQIVPPQKEEKQGRMEQSNPKKIMEDPKFQLTVELMRDYMLPKNDLGQSVLYTTDIQHLLQFAMEGPLSNQKPRWCNLTHQRSLSSIFLAIVDSASANDFRDHSQFFPFLRNSCKTYVEVISPSQYFGSVDEELFFVSKPNGKFQYANIKATKLDLLMTTEDMKMDGYTLPLENNVKSKDFVFTKDQYEIPNEHSPMFSIDCEMVETSGSSELASICVVNENLECVYESLVKPRNEITNYVTRYSGITEKLLKDVTTTLEDVQKQLQFILPRDSILVGQSLNFDLDALKIFHPYVVDTSSLYNLSGYRERKSKLQMFAKLFLNRDIQNAGNNGHNPKEDAEAAMQLVLLKLQMGLRFGNVLMGWTIDELQKSNLHFTSPAASMITVSNGNHSKDNKYENSGEGDKRKQKLAFFRPSKHRESLFNFVSKAGKSSTAINCTIPNIQLPQVKFITIDDDEANSTTINNYCDSLICRRSRDEVQTGGSYFTVAQFSEIKALTGVNHSNCCDDKKDHKCEKCFTRSLKDTDRYLKKISKVLSPRCLYVVIFTGRVSENGAQNGLCFVKVRGETV